jgi:hypothetical protein
MLCSQILTASGKGAAEIFDTVLGTFTALFWEVLESRFRFAADAQKIDFLWKQGVGYAY